MTRELPSDIECPDSVKLAWFVNRPALHFLKIQVFGQVHIGRQETMKRHIHMFLQNELKDSTIRYRYWRAYVITGYGLW
ncbi:hypothetical protein HMPREF9061_01062 [Actinomyces sp. oral taxon 181 str. F0379]|nr:hypothetical protein HMPREF9061_01062 [Actinomyces sp. oral taxon 181 str. F0379]